MGCAVFFDLAEAGFPFWWLPIAGAVGAIALYGVYRFYRAVAPAFLQARAAPKVGLFGALVALSVFSIYLPAKAFLEYRQALRMVAERNVKRIAGPITDFLPDGSGRIQFERFSVYGVPFAFDPNEIKPGFRVTQRMGSPLKDGVYVRITYVDDVIIRLELCHEGECMS